MSHPMYSISREPRREDHTICTAIAPDVVFTVRTYSTGPLYNPRLGSAQIRATDGKIPQVSEPFTLQAADRVTSQGDRHLRHGSNGRPPRDNSDRNCLRSRATRKPGRIPPALVSDTKPRARTRSGMRANRIGMQFGPVCMPVGSSSRGHAPAAFCEIGRAHV